MVFLGVPHEGSNLLLYRIGWYFALFNRPYGSSTELLDLVAGSKYLELLQKRFLETYGSIFLASFYECISERLLFYPIGTVSSN